jgi:two-component system sensor histidine kinase FlrB
MPLTALDTSQSIENAVINPKDLSAAFEVFNNVSAQLADTYKEMEDKVGLLNEELHDVAEQRLQELQEKERVSQRLESLLNLLPAGVVVLDSKGIVTQCNPAALDLLGEPLEGQLWRDVIRRSFLPRSDDGHEISLHDGRRISISTRSFEQEAGQILLLTDLTETRELQKRLNRHRRLSEMGKMMSSLAHQIRTPLSAAMLYAGHLCESDLNPTQIKRFSTKVLSRLNHLEQQVKDMLIFVRGDVKLTDTLSVADLLAALEQAMEMPMVSSQSTYTINNQCAQAQLHCNRESMVGALMNLVTNAIQAVGRQAAITITSRLLVNGDIEITIADQGPGIAPEVISNLDEPFYTTKEQGTGLGLAVVRAVAQAHQGEFQLSSELGKGVQATMVLPVFSCNKLNHIKFNQKDLAVG